MSIYDSMNERQREAVFHTEGPLLILAGAGSGKTRVLTHRIAYLIEEKGVNPWNILAITFTNKAAGEMRERVDRLVAFGAESVWVSTFHSACVRILRRHIDRLGYDSKFTIYDSDDQKTLMKDICKRLQIDTKQWKEKTLLGIISSAKNELIGAQEYEMNTMGDFSKRKIAEAYKEYQRQLRTNNALDFDDLIMKTVELFKLNPDVLEAYQERFKYIMVDEYQDTNTAQFKLISLLASKYQNLCVVGDDDQSIYKFRGANIRNILNFEDVFPSARVVKLEQNYRSTKTILDAANHVIRNNLERKNKTLWTANDGGAPIIFQNFMTAYEEAEYIAEDLAKRVAAGDGNYSDCAILYRTNAQSRLLEEKFLLANIPYRIIGGVNFYARKEIKDLLSYLKTVDNARDDLAVRRIINVPRRGIGAATLAKVQDFAVENEISFYNALRAAEEIPALGRSVAKLKPFVTLIQTLRAQQEYFSVAELLKEVIDRTDYVKELEDENTEESRARIENIDELISKAASYDEEAENPTLSGFLEEVALVADIDNLEENNDRVVLMTLHSAKGLEFPNVYLAGMEDGIFPSYMTIVSEDPTDLEEERRLCYVGITRAMRQLTITSARSRMIRGETQYNKVSRFIQEIPRELVQVGSMIKPKVQELPKQTAYIQAKQAFQAKAFEPKQYKVTKADKLEYGVGDRVKHIKFGAGTVENIVEGGKDYEVTVNFDRAGVKKMFAAFAKLKRE
ncbi:MAG: DNA helicase PcrA [Lachnospiraceae bacterium]|jgi:DNA helicase-2/ATP-dependent DNA helicase PcrA|uniref:DNA helicase PcrA n=1 Tax=Hominisplanchenecus murintestinalis TaxID=2941517 RepID=A0AC61QVY7_9FIRM|nr:DNA helicase PcrA [Hominisplanchenecus murintestinalis]MCI9517097.1 DNA helicase PcrA [Lachnospiraceae bacterium]RKJ95253.1 DNA helicase PcrA [Anaerotruncus sp. 1XD22-93]MCI9661965.1 DNA helicase PcrA [Lachnospiraceae bacterium]NBH97855.1 DNA helicase PcrA [Lachnospiraceae bacterium]NBI74829.1 DNA helicase PcrA [Lachnospiraceae bacterium]